MDEAGRRAKAIAFAQDHVEQRLVYSDDNGPNYYATFVFGFELYRCNAEKAREAVREAAFRLMSESEPGTILKEARFEGTQVLLHDETGL